MSGSTLKIAVVTESRADYGIYFPLLKSIQTDKRFELNLIVTGQHWLLDYGHTASEVLNEFGMEALKTYQFDWLIVLGDRRPMLEAAIEAAYCGKAIAHIQGGDRTGNIDDPARHAITRFANLHFSCTQQSADRLIKMGEEAWRINIIGPLGIYAMPDAQFMTKTEICDQWGLDEKREIVLIIQHPVSTQITEAGEQMRQTLEAVKGLQTIVIYPNSDLGSQDMIHEIETCVWVYKFKSLTHLTYLSLLKVCDAIVGNSSSGLYEAPLFGIPAVNIGIRQQNRERGWNVLDCEHDAKAIRYAIDVILVAETPVSRFNPFAVKVDGVKVILDALANTPINEHLLQKRITY